MAKTSYLSLQSSFDQGRGMRVMFIFIEATLSKRQVNPAICPKQQKNNNFFLDRLT